MLFRVMSMEMTIFKFDLVSEDRILSSSILGGMLMIYQSHVPRFVTERLSPSIQDLEHWFIPMEVGLHLHLDMQTGQVINGQKGHMPQ